MVMSGVVRLSKEQRAVSGRVGGAFVCACACAYVWLCVPVCACVCLCVSVRMHAFLAGLAFSFLFQNLFFFHIDY